MRRFQLETERALKGDTPLTGKAELKRQGLSDAVLIDVAASALKRTTAPAAAKQDFVTNFGRSYGSTAESALIKTAPQIRGGITSGIRDSATKGSSGDATTEITGKKVIEPTLPSPGIERQYERRGH